MKDAVRISCSCGRSRRCLVCFGTGVARVELRENGKARRRKKEPLPPAEREQLRAICSSHKGALTQLARQLRTDTGILRGAIAGEPLAPYRRQTILDALATTKEGERGAL